MTRDECLAAIQGGIIPPECVLTYSGVPQHLQLWLSIGASVAVIAAAVFAWRQISLLKTQLLSGETGVISQIGSAKHTARLTQTLTLITNLQTNSHWKENRIEFIKLRESKEIRKHANQDTEDAQCIRQYLNHYELIALGIDLGIIEYSMYKRYYRGTIIRDWNECYPFVEDERKENSKYWVEVENLVTKLKAEPN